MWGAEDNTPFTTLEVFRKILRKEHNTWDISALVASLVGTTINLLVTFASRQTLFGDSVWRQWALSWGPLVSGIAVTLDYYGGMIELGFLFGSFEIRLTEYEQWRAQTGQGLVLPETKLAELESKLDQLVDRWAWPTANADQVKRATAHLNGDRANLTRQEVGLLLAEHQLNLPSQSTVKRGLGG